MDTKHTPGPWKDPRPWTVMQRLSDLQSGLDVYVGLEDEREKRQDFSLTYAEQHVARVFGSPEEQARRARLIACAPEMLEALERALPTLVRAAKAEENTAIEFLGLATDIREVRSLIARARGEEQKP